MELFNECFKDLVFTRVDEKMDYVIYVAGISTGLGAGVQRYILLFVPKHLAFANQSRIEDLQWQNLQTRQLSYSYRLKKQPWAIPREFKDILLSIKDRKKAHSVYTAADDRFPFEILLLHDAKKKTSFQYHNKLTLTAAIDTFNAVFNYTGEMSQPMYAPGPMMGQSPANMLNPQYGSNTPAALPNIKNWFRAGGDAEYTTSTDFAGSDKGLDDSFELLH